MMRPWGAISATATAQRRHNRGTRSQPGVHDLAERAVHVAVRRGAQVVVQRRARAVKCPCVREAECSRTLAMRGPATHQFGQGTSRPLTDAEVSELHVLLPRFRGEAGPALSEAQVLRCANLLA